VEEKREQRRERRVFVDLPPETFERYQQTGDVAVRNEILEHYYPLVRRIAEGLAMTLSRRADVDDLASNGVLGLADALAKFEPRRGTPFKSFCSLRVRGAMIDGIRRDDWVPRNVRNKQNTVERVIREIEGEMGRAATDAELAARMGMSVDGLRTFLRRIAPVHVMSLQESWQSAGAKAVEASDILADERQEAPWQRAEQSDLLERVTEVLEPRERHLLLLYYFEHLSMREIAEALEVSESRVCQLHRRTVNRVREHLRRAKARDIAPCG
jgi:RNA polymerase sigma factor for flagellar operon FliA